MSVVLTPLFVSLLITLAVTPLIRRLGQRQSLLDHPNERSSHTSPTPRGGGIAILAGLFAAMLVRLEWPDPVLLTTLGWLGVVAGMGLIDDLKSLPATVKLLVQVGAATAVLLMADLTLGTIQLPIVGDVALPAGVGFGLTLFWIVGVTNAYNFMDGVNGIASIEAVVCAGAYAMIFATRGDVGTAALCLGISGSAAGFLVYNASGSIFMGDVGSVSLGFLFSVLALRLTLLDVPFFVVVLPLLPFLLDTAATLVRRSFRRERLLSAHRSHYYQRLTDLGMAHMTVATLYGLLALACSVVAVQWRSFSVSGLVWSVALLTLTLVVGGAMIEWRLSSRQA